jgi:hypothetical protein
MKIDDYKKSFEIKHEEGWMDDNVWFAKCKICWKIIFDKYLIRNWYLLNGNQRKKRFYTAIRRHINTYHSELVIERIKLVEQDIALKKSLHFLKNFPFMSLKEERIPPKIWKPEIIVLPNKRQNRDM